MLEYGLVKPRCVKTLWVFILHQQFLLFLSKNIYITKPANHFYQIYNVTFNHSQLLKQKQLGDRNCLSYGQQQQWEAVPPYQLLESAQTATPQDPRACSGLPGQNQVQQQSNTSLQNSVSNINLSVSSPSQQAIINQVTAAFLSEQLPYKFSLFFPNEFPEYHST